MSDNIKDVVKVVTRTAIGGQVLSSIFFGRQHEIYEHSTLNELVNDSIAVPYQPSVATMGSQTAEPYDPEKDVDDIELAYMAIGIKGHKTVTDSNQIDITLPIEHKATDTGLYQIVPFVIKPIASDLSADQRRKFRLRKVLEIEGELYAAYYLRRLDSDNVAPSLVLNSVEDGEKTSTPWTPSIDNLRPTPPAIGYENDASYLTVVSNVELVFDEQDIEWYLDAMEMLFGNRHYAITELAYCTGVDKQITKQYPSVGAQSPSSGIKSLDLKEAQAVQVAFFVNTDLNPSVLSRGFSYTVNIGISEPLFANNGI